MKINSYLTFNGNCREAFAYYEKQLGGRIEYTMTHGESPMADQVPAAMKSRVMHTSMVLGNTVLMGSDALEGVEGCPAYEGMKGCSLSINVDDEKEADRLFAALAQDGQVKMPITETFWAKRFGMCVDQFGVAWMVNCEKPMA